LPACSPEQSQELGAGSWCVSVDVKDWDRYNRAPRPRWDLQAAAEQLPGATTTPRADERAACDAEDD
jgi:hypothetical protein